MHVAIECLITCRYARARARARVCAGVRACACACDCVYACVFGRRVFVCMRGHHIRAHGAVCAHLNVNVPAACDGVCMSSTSSAVPLPQTARCVFQAADPALARTLQEVQGAAQKALALVGELAEAQSRVAGLQGHLQRLQQKKEACVSLLAANQLEAELLGVTSPAPPAFYSALVEPFEEILNAI